MHFRHIVGKAKIHFRFTKFFIFQKIFQIFSCFIDDKTSKKICMVLQHIFALTRDQKCLFFGVTVISFGKNGLCHSVVLSMTSVFISH